MASILLTIGVLGALVGGGFLLMKAPTLSSVSRETMIDNIKNEYSTLEESDVSSIPQTVEEKKDIFSVPFGVDSKKNRLDMLFSDVSSGIKKGSSNDNEESEKKKSNVSFLRSFFSFLSKIKGLIFLLLALLLLVFSTRKSSNKKK